MPEGNNAPPCPKCGSDEVWEFICSIPWSEEHSTKWDNYDKGLRPCEAFECQDCGYRWDNPEYEKYLLTRAVK